MTSAEFRSWFKGFIEGLQGKQPNKKQWAVIVERIDQINEVPTPYPIFIERYWPFPERPWYKDWTYRTQPNTGTPQDQLPYQVAVADSARFYTANEGFQALGRLDAESACLQGG